MRKLKQLLYWFVIDNQESRIGKQLKGETRAEKILACLKDLRRTLIWQFGILVYFIFLESWLLSRVENRIVLILNNIDIMMIGVCIGIIYPIYANLRRYHEIKCLERSEAGLKTVNLSTAKSSIIQKIDIAVGIISLTLAIICVGSGFAMIAQRTDKGLPEHMENIPSISLKTLENNVQYRHKVSPIYKGKVELMNRLSTRVSLTVPTQYEIIESGEIPSLMWADKSGVYSPSINTMYYETRGKMVAKPLFDYVVAHLMLSYVDAIPKKVDGFDEVYTLEDGIKKEIAFRRGNHVALVSYYGNKTLEELMEEVVKKYAN
jgi:hypothetical protein